MNDEFEGRRERHMYERGTTHAHDARTQTRMVIEGHVRLGDQRGRTIGFPTANLAVTSGSILPPSGVFAGYVHLQDGRWFPAAVSVGRRETFYDTGDLLVEAHLLDFAGDLYGTRIVVELVAVIREQVKFPGIDELKAQLAQDVRDCAEALDRLAPRVSAIAA